MSAIAPAGLSGRQFQLCARLVQNRVGIQLPPANETIMRGRLRKRSRALRLVGLDDHGRHICEGNNHSGESIERFTTNKTDLIREPVHFDFLRDQVVLVMLKFSRREPLTFCSAASTTGAKIYMIPTVVGMLGAI